MEPTPSSPGRSPELPAVSPPSSQERVGQFSHAEVSTEKLAERQEQRNGAPSASEQAAPPPPIVLPLPAADPVTDDQATTSPLASGLPSVAGDDDLIEKEWVTKAKKVIAETKDDPYRREQEVGRLQADYLAKRYGRESGPSQ